MNGNIILRRATIGLAIVIPALAVFANGLQIEMNRHSIDGGGGTSTGGGFELSGTLGRPDAGVLTGGAFVLSGGFSFGPLSGDCDLDGQVGLGDYLAFEACHSGPGGGLGEGCHCVDFDGSDAVDLLDFAKLQVVFGR